MNCLPSINNHEETLKCVLAVLQHAQMEAALYKKKFEQSSQAYDRLLFAFKQSQRRNFGSSSERFIDDNPAQGDFFSTVEAKESLPDESDTNEEPNPNTQKKSNGRKRKKKNKDFAKNLPRREVIIEAEGKTEDDRVIRYETTELLNYIPAVYEIIVQKREVLARKGGINKVTKIITAINPQRFLPQAKVTETFLAHIIVSKLYDRQPLYHLEKKFKERFDFTCQRNKLARWFIQSAVQLQPIVNLMRDQIFEYDVTGCDPTHLQVLNEPGRSPKQKSYVYSIRGGPTEQLVNLFEYNAEDNKIFLDNWFKGYSGYLHVDGQNIFENFEMIDNITLVFCNSHARRKFEPIAKAASKPGLASKAMRYFRAIYKIERKAKQERLSPEQRYMLRQKETRPIMEEMFNWMREVAPTTLPKSPLGKAFLYALSREKGLKLFLDDGRLEIDTNLIEQQNKNLALARNNFMFSYSVEGAHALCVHMSLIFTAIAHGLDPYHYYVHIMKKAPYCETVEDYEQLLPWNVTLTSAELMHQQAV